MDYCSTVGRFNQFCPMGQGLQSWACHQDDREWLEQRKGLCVVLATLYPYLRVCLSVAAVVAEETGKEGGEGHSGQDPAQIGPLDWWKHLPDHPRHNHVDYQRDNPRCNGAAPGAAGAYRCAISYSS